jgi:parallel beta-helix repeat protein
MSHAKLMALAPFALLVCAARASITQISACPLTISQSGQYHIAKDLTCPAGPLGGIEIAADNVQLFFDGHTLNGAGTGAFGVLVVGSNASIFGAGTVRGFQFGIVFEGPDEDEPSSGNRMVNITVTNSLSIGIVVAISVQNTIINCTANNNSADGFFLGAFSSGNTLTANTASGNAESGIELFSTSGNTLIANQTDGNGFDGIVVDFGLSGNVMQANRAHNNIRLDLADFNAGCDSDVWRANQFRTANQSCIK